uniref:Uncharacterized protein n=1 Tax=Tetraselmis sp. GSL018 TaxID=582737 RepID=A0A061SN71_9CHLO
MQPINDFFAVRERGFYTMGASEEIFLTLDTRKCTCQMLLPVMRPQKRTVKPGSISQDALLVGG